MRYRFLDIIRGLVLLSMAAYHGMWNMVNIFDLEAPWYNSVVGLIWQQSICWSFILISGFCFAMSKNKLLHGTKIFACGILLSVVTLVVMPQNRIIFGILTFMGSAALITLALEDVLKKIDSKVGLTIALILFTVIWNINKRSVGFLGYAPIALPEFLYQNYFTTYLGFMHKGFYSADYFALLPWLPLFFVGYFAYRVIKLPDKSRQKNNPIELIGRHSLLFYMLHQPIIFGIMYIAEQIRNIF